MLDLSSQRWGELSDAYGTAEKSLIFFDAYPVCRATKTMPLQRIPGLLANANR